MKILIQLLSSSIFSILVIFSSCKPEVKDILDFVDPMIGTDETGHTFPGSTLPFGMVQLSPSDGERNWKYCSGYHYDDKTIKGFAHNHFSGTGLWGLGDILLMPMGGELFVNEGSKETPELGFRSGFSHANESASAGYYAVQLDDNNVKVELTCTPRVGFHRYTFNEAGEQHVIIDPTHSIMEKHLDAEIEILSDTEIQGYRNCFGAGGDRNVFFYAKFSKPFEKYGVVINDSIAENRKKEKTKNLKAFVTYQGSENEELIVKVAISYVDYEGAKVNFLAEAENKDFNTVHKEAKALWREKISKIQIETPSVEKARTFYTGMYHSFIAPNIISDVNGNYIVDGKKYTSKDIVQYSTFSTWDTYRATHPLWTIIDQKSNSDFVKVLVSRYTESNVGLAIWEAVGFDNLCMIGLPGISAMAEAALKHTDDISEQKMIFDCIKKASFATNKSSPNYGVGNGVEDYIKLGYVPAKWGCSVSKTTEYNYHDFSVAQLAKKLGAIEDEKLFRKRSQTYRLLYNKDKKYLWPRATTGEFIEMDTTLWSSLKPNYISGNIWAYSAYTPHDMQAAIELFGGKEKYAQWLDKVFSDTTQMQGEQHVDISGFIGKYGHGDEPGHHMPYLYNFVNQPWKTQKLVNQVLTTMYSDQPDGLVNNEDCGQMSSWYIFSSLGFYPVAPSDLNYYIGAPLHNKATIHLENGKTFSVIANNISDENIYVQSLTLNGENYEKSYIRHEDIMQGGELIFEMGSQPNKIWATSENAVPVMQ